MYLTRKIYTIIFHLYLLFCFLGRIIIFFSLLSIRNNLNNFNIGMALPGLNFLEMSARVIYFDYCIFRPILDLEIVYVTGFCFCVLKSEICELKNKNKMK